MGCRLALAALVAAAGLMTPVAAAAEPSEAELKAEMVERFTRFVDWEPSDLPGESLAICVVGESPLTQPLDRIARSRKIKDRKAAVKTVDAAAAADCHVVLIGGTDRKRLTAVLARTEGRPILTIADAPGAGAGGSIINFYLDGKHVKFEVNARAARDSGLKVRAKLLRLARVVGKP
jgi:hypothetical protein